MDVGGSFLRPNEEAYKCSANNAVHLKLVSKQDELKDDATTFHPEMSHQFFGDSETIFGYKNLNIQLYYHAGSLLTYLGMTYTEKISASLGVQPDSVLPTIAEKLPTGYLTNFDEFQTRLEAENSFQPIGNKIHSYTSDGKEFEIYEADISCTKLRDYHDRLQTFILWYIDAASFIDVDDEKWNFFLVFQRSQQQDNVIYNIVGYSTVYHYYAYPCNTRPRISQMLVLPPYQKKGHGAALLKCIYGYYTKDENVIDITVEDPSEEFVRLRDYVDCKNCSALASFSSNNLAKGFTDEMESEARTKFKINKQQCRRVYEILRLRATDRSNVQQYQQYRLSVKNRLNVPFQKQARDIKKAQKSLSSEEYQAAMVGNNPQERIQRLDESYRVIEEEYKKVIDRMEIC